MSIITIATDFGTIDGYVGAVKGVIKSMSPDFEVIDITHDLEGILKTSITLKRYYPFYPAGTIHLVVVDPTVGSQRKALIGSDGKYFYVGPDNGVFSRIAEDNPESRWWEIDSEKVKQQDISSTFHGRDIFAPAAALIALGKQPEDLGQRVESPVMLRIPVVRETGSGIEGEIIDIDKFGNLMSNIRGERLPESASVILGECQPVKLKRTYSDVQPGMPLAYIGSLGYLEIGINQGRANEYFGASTGDKVRVAN